MMLQVKYTACSITILSPDNKTFFKKEMASASCFSED